MNPQAPVGRPLLDVIVTALLTELLEELPQNRRPTDAGPAEAARTYVVAALLAAPWHIQAAERIVRPAVALWVGLGGTPTGFARLGGPFASFIRLYRSLALIAYIEHPAARRAVGGETTTDRQDRFRALRAAVSESAP